MIVPSTAERPAPAFVRFLHLIRFSHTIFALPFALGALVVAAHGRPGARTLVLVILAMVFARTAAMLFNRLADWSIDQRNPRTVSRHRLLPRPVILLALVIISGAFLATAALINSLTAWLAPFALAILFFYSLTKRFTAATHFVLGLALGIAPIAAWIAQTGTIAPPPLMLGAGVLCWVAGFDLIYATQDVEFDRREQLHSLVVKLGVARSLRLAQWLHVATFAALAGFGFLVPLGRCYFCALPLIAAALYYEHRVAQHANLATINRAFFQVNAVVSALFFAAVCADQWA